MSKPTILKNKIVGEFVSKEGKKAEDKICYLFLESDRKLSLTVSGQAWSLLLPLSALRAFVNRAYHEVGKKETKVEIREVRRLKTKHSIAPERRKTDHDSEQKPTRESRK